ncbi:oxidoreductase [Novosphingobium sp. MMS21-SN21R]|uniref:oxidoreductase n=1 Tax=Novosphingobium sp. MMS21-SN21R TaxID=2969298 RepID=UPI00288665F8|nr:oxidoreductase [Novosphingobium sp. MMS21-SN21R]MDT0507642.1 oxidoreductase [Novosphingobium sp. MMS21-SN21R]
MPAPHNVALIGYGYAGKTFHAPLIEAADGLALAAVVSRDAAKVHADLPGMRVEPDLAAVLADPSIALVVIATPNDSHAPLAHAAIEAGKAVVVDKPLALTLAEAREIVAHAKARGVLLSIFHNRRWDGDFLSIRHAIAQGTIGEVAHFESHFDRFRPVVRDRWREKPGPGSGVWADLGPHLVDQALCLFGSPTRVIASLGALRDGATTDDWAHVVLEYPRLRCVLNAGMLVAGGSPRFIVHGSGGSLIKHGLDPQEAQLVRGIRPGDAGWADDPQPMDFYNVEGAPSPVPLQGGDYPQFYTKMAAALDGGDVPVRPQEALFVMAVVEAAALAASTGQAQTVATIG